MITFFTEDFFYVIFWFDVEVGVLDLNVLDLNVLAGMGSIGPVLARYWPLMACLWVGPCEGNAS